MLDRGVVKDSGDKEDISGDKEARGVMKDSGADGTVIGTIIIDIMDIMDIMNMADIDVRS
jgi:hypothetical protein